MTTHKILFIIKLSIFLRRHRKVYYLPSIVLLTKDYHIKIDTLAFSLHCESADHKTSSRHRQLDFSNWN